MDLIREMLKAAYLGGEQTLLHLKCAWETVALTLELPITGHDTSFAVGWRWDCCFTGISGVRGCRMEHNTGLSFMA